MNTIQPLTPTQGFFWLPKDPEALWPLPGCSIGYREKDSSEAKVQLQDTNDDSLKSLQQKAIVMYTYGQSLANGFLP